MKLERAFKISRFTKHLTQEQIDHLIESHKEKLNTDYMSAEFVKYEIKYNSETVTIDKLPENKYVDVVLYFNIELTFETSYEFDLTEFVELLSENFNEDDIDEESMYGKYVQSYNVEYSRGEISVTKVIEYEDSYDVDDYIKDHPEEVNSVFEDVIGINLETISYMLQTTDYSVYFSIFDDDITFHILPLSDVTNDMMEINF